MREIPTRYLLEFGYDGTGFVGWARQPGRRTVEGVIRDGVRRLGIAPSADDARLEVASRTDAGVSARANALALSSHLEEAAVLRAMNGIAPDLLFRAIAAVPDSFRVRRARRRTYRYFLPGPRARAARLAPVARALGDRVDVRSFGRGIPLDHPLFRPIEPIRLRPGVGGVWIEVSAPSFVWGMVRKIVAAMLAVEAGRLSLEAIGAAARGERVLSLPLAPADGLILWRVEHDVRFSLRTAGLLRRQSAYREDALRGATNRQRLVPLVFALSGSKRLDRGAPGPPGG